MSVFNYSISVTGDCSNSNVGSISLLLTGGTPPYTVQWLDPVLSPNIVTTLPAVKTGLSADTYAVRVNDSTLPTNAEFYINIPVSSGVCATVLSVQNTTCGNNNGSATITSTSDYSSTNFYLYHGDGTYSQSAVTSQQNLIFGNLTAGTYYATVEDLGGCTAQTSNFIIESSPLLNYGLYAIPNSACGGSPIGKIMVTGLTGTGPFTYLWSTSATGSTVTGLTAGIYSVDVTDAYGCINTQSATITDVPQLGFGTFTATQPSCFSNDGVLTIQITGGTAPYYFSASTGQVTVQYGTSWTLSGLSPGDISVMVTDAGLCTFTQGTVLTTPNGITSVSINSQGSTCSSSGGTISIAVNGGSTPYTYTLIYPNGDVLNVASSQTNQLFSNLYSGTYTVSITDASGCFYMDEVTLFATNTFTISTQVTGTTCNQNNGLINVIKTSGGEPPYDYSLDGLFNVLDTSLSSVTFNNVSSGQHTITVTDNTGCTQTLQVYVDQSPTLNYSLYTTSCGTGSDGTITTFISSGEPPFTFDWSDNVPNNPQEIKVSGLTAGTYNVTIIDSNGCSLQRFTDITCDASYASYQTYVMGSEVFNIQSQTKYGLIQMLNDGFDDLTSGNTSCSLISATFTVNVSVNPLGITTSDTFFTTTSLVVAPSDNDYYDTVVSLLQTIPGIGNVTVDAVNNQIKIETNPNDNSLNGQEIIVELLIVYDTICLT